MSNATINVGSAVPVRVDDCCENATASSELAGEQTAHDSDEWDWTQDVQCSACGAGGAFCWSEPEGPFDGGAYAIEGPFRATVSGADEEEL